MAMQQFREIERNATGSRIVKVTGDHMTFYVEHVPSRLAKVTERAANGRFASSVRGVATTPETRTGWKIGRTFGQLTVARTALGINTERKKVAA
jgi:hypothetical protein